MTTNLVTTGGRDCDQWRSCAGEISHVVHRLRWHRRAARIRTASLFVVLAAVAIGGSYLRSDITTELSIEATGSPCEHYSEELRSFYCDKTQIELEPKLWEHLAHCRDCSESLVFFGGISHSGHHHANTHDGHAHVPAANSATASLETLLRDGTLAVQP